MHSPANEAKRTPRILFDEPFDSEFLKSPTTIVTPAEERGWDVWNWSGKRSKFRKTIDMLDELPSDGKGAIVGLPARECTSFSVTVPTADQALFPDMVHAQVEKRGLIRSGHSEEAVFAYHIIERERGESLIGVDVLPSDFSTDLCSAHAVGYTAAGRLFSMPDHAAAVIREHGRLVLLAGKHGKVTFSQILTAGEHLNEAVAQELNLTILSLQGSGQLAERASLEIWLDASSEAQEALKRKLSLPVDFRPRPAPDAHLVKDASNPMLPLPVRTALLRERRNQKIRTGALALLAIYITAAMGLFIFFQDREKRAAQTEIRIADRRPEAEFIRQSMTRARILAPAIDKRFYPLRQLDQISGLMPPSGLVVHRFITQGENVRLEGLARDSQLVYQLKEDLEKNSDFRGYTWDMAPPQVNSENNSTSFRLEGKFASGP